MRVEYIPVGQIVNAHGIKGEVKLNPMGFRVSDIEKTSVCPLARTIRGLCRKEGIKGVKVVWSAEQPVKATLPEEHGRHAPGSISFVPAAAGLCIAAEVVRELLK